MTFDHAPRVPPWAETLVRAARASLAAGIAAWRSERTSCRTLRAGIAAGRPERTRWRTLLASIAVWRSVPTSWLLGACTASACVTALFGGWLMSMTSRPRAATIVAIERETAATAAPAPGRAADVRDARVAARDAPRRTPAAAPVPSARRAEWTPAVSGAQVVDADREVAAPARGHARTAPTSTEATEAREPAAHAPARVAPEDAAAGSAAAASDGAPAARAATVAMPTDEQPARRDAAAPAPIPATTAALPTDEQAGQDDEAALTPSPAATEGADPVPARAAVASGVPSDEGSPPAREGL